MKSFHCCATCQHFAIEKTAQGPQYRCARLGYATHPKYRFNCWNPKAQVRKLLAAQHPSEPLK